jgi:GT2 family glycosyltransferase
VGPQLVHPDGRKQNSIHPYPSLLTEMVPRGVLETLFPRRFPSKRFEHARPVDVECVLGACIAVRRAALDAVGALPEDYFFFLEETEWCLRVRAAGWRVVHFPSVYVVHLSGASSKRRSPALTRIEYHRSLYRFFRKYRGPVSAHVVLGVRFAKALFYVVTQAPFVLVGSRHRARWSIHRDVFLWHLRGCPATVGLGRIAGFEAEASRRGAGPTARGAGADAAA